MDCISELLKRMKKSSKEEELKLKVVSIECSKPRDRAGYKRKGFLEYTSKNPFLLNV